jgi:hypothetical protein
MIVSVSHWGVFALAANLRANSEQARHSDARCACGLWYENFEFWLALHACIAASITRFSALFIA